MILHSVNQYNLKMHLETLILTALSGLEPEEPVISVLNKITDQCTVREKCDWKGKSD